MILDTGICKIYRVRAGRPQTSPTSGLKAVYNNWYATLGHESGGGGEAGDNQLRIRCHDGDIAEYDIAMIGKQPWRVTRVYHGKDDENGQPIADLTLVQGPRHFVLLKLIPRTVTMDSLNTMTGLPDMERSKSIWGSIGAVNADEYYEAEAAGHELSLRAEIYAADYDSEPYIEYKDNVYQAVRTELRGPMVNIICEAVVSWPE